MEKFFYILLLSIITSFGFIFFNAKRNWFLTCRKSKSKTLKKIGYGFFHVETTFRKLALFFFELGSNLLLTLAFSKLSGIHWFYSFENCMMILSFVFVFKVALMLLVYCRFYDPEKEEKIQPAPITQEHENGTQADL